jgi:SSS family transporter
MSTQAVILTGVSVYMLAMLAVGYLAAGRTHSVGEFIVAGRGLPTWLLTPTVIATWFGGVAIMGFAGTAYEEGLFGVIADPFGGALALILIGLFFARLFRRLRIMTVADFMEQRFGTVAAMAITAVQLFANILWVGAMLVAFGLVAEQLTGLPMAAGIVAGALVIFFYTAIGGMWAVAMTDFVQIIIVFAGLVILFIVVLVDVGGWGVIAPQLPEGTFRMLPRENSWETWLNYLRAWTIIGLVDISAQSLVQRVSAARSERVAQNAFYLGGLGYLFFGMIPVLLGIIGSVTMPGLASPESVVPALALEHLHPVAIAIFVGAVLAAIMSSADSVLLACASLLAKNVLPLVKKDPAPRLGLVVARLSIPVFGSIAIVIAINIRDVYDLMVNANMLGLAAIIVPFVLGVWWQKANRTGALAAMAVGIAAWLVTLFVAPGLPADFVGLAASLVTMLVVTPLTQTLDPPRALRDADGNRVELQNRLGTLSPFGGD